MFYKIRGFICTSLRSTEIVLDERYTGQYDNYGPSINKGAVSFRFSLNSYSLARYIVDFSIKVPDYCTITLFQRPNTCFYK